MSVSDNNKNRGAHGDSSFMLDGLPSSSENPPFSTGGVSIKKIEGRLKAALSDLVYVLNQHSLCEICKYADADCKPDTGDCVPQWRGMV